MRTETEVGTVFLSLSLSLMCCIAAESGVGEVHNFAASEQIRPQLLGGRLEAAPPQLVPHCFKLSPALVQAFKYSERDTGEGGRL